MNVKDDEQVEGQPVPEAPIEQEENPKKAKPTIAVAKGKPASKIAAGTLGYIAGLSLIYGVFSYKDPEFVKLALENIPALTSILLGTYILLMSLSVLLGRINISTFVDIDRKVRAEISPKGGFSGLSAISKSVLGLAGPILGVNFSIDDQLRKMELLSQSVIAEASEEIKNQAKAVPPLGTAYENYIYKVVDSLDKHIYLTEEKASTLLDRGILFLFGGITFYIAAIIGWQAWAKFSPPSSEMLYLGMAECSVVFIVCEFLAAWFLKQYRHYADASLACMRVKSVYDRYLLSYYSVKEFNSSNEEQKDGLKSLLEVLKEDAQWPTHKDNLSNDFNFMIESVSSMNSTLDKLKGAFNSKEKKSKGKNQE